MYLLSLSLSNKNESENTNRVTVLILYFLGFQFDANCGEYSIQGRGDSVSVHSTETSNTDSGRGSNEDPELHRQNLMDSTEPTSRVGHYNGRWSYLGEYHCVVTKL